MSVHDTRYTQQPMNELTCGTPQGARGCYNVNCHGNITPADDLIQSGRASVGHMTGKKELDR